MCMCMYVCTYACVCCVLIGVCRLAGAWTYEDICRRDAIVFDSMTHICRVHTYLHISSTYLPTLSYICTGNTIVRISYCNERWGAGVETQKNVREEIGGWVRVPFNEPYAPSLSTIYDGP